MHYFDDGNASANLIRWHSRGLKTELRDRSEIMETSWLLAQYGYRQCPL
jgi:hypothetical protein